MSARVALLALLLLGCEGPDFDRPSLVTSTRLIAVIAEPPELAPGADLEMRAVVVGPGADTVEVRYSIDLSPRALAAAAGQDLFEPAEPISLEGGRLDGALTRAAIDALRERIDGAVAGTPEAVVRHVYEEVGLVAAVRVEVIDADGELLVEAVKRVSLIERAPTTNPPAPRFAIDGRFASGRQEAIGECVAESEPLIAPANAEVTLAPEADEAWLETFRAIDLAGQTVEGSEDAYYSWFTTGGELRFDVTRPPERDVVWTTPGPGVYSLWLVVRDGHLGTSACRAEVEVR